MTGVYMPILSQLGFDQQRGFAGLLDGARSYFAEEAVQSNDKTFFEMEHSLNNLHAFQTRLQELVQEGDQGKVSDYIKGNEAFLRGYNLSEYGELEGFHNYILANMKFPAFYKEASELANKGNPDEVISFMNDNADIVNFADLSHFGGLEKFKQTMTIRAQIPGFEKELNRLIDEGDSDGIEELINGNQDIVDEIGEPIPKTWLERAMRNASRNLSVASESQRKQGEYMLSAFSIPVIAVKNILQLQNDLVKGVTPTIHIGFDPDHGIVIDLTTTNITKDRLHILSNTMAGLEKLTGMDLAWPKALVHDADKLLDNPTAALILDIAGEIILDPTTYIGIGAATKVGLVGKSVGFLKAFVKTGKISEAVNAVKTISKLNKLRQAGYGYKAAKEIAEGTKAVAADAKLSAYLDDAGRIIDRANDVNVSAKSHLANYSDDLPGGTINPRTKSKYMDDFFKYVNDVKARSVQRITNILSKKGSLGRPIRAMLAKPIEIGENTMKIGGLNAKTIQNSIESAGHTIQAGDVYILRSVNGRAFEILPYSDDLFKELNNLGDGSLARVFRAEGVGYNGGELIFVNATSEFKGQMGQINDLENAMQAAGNKEMGGISDITNSSRRVMIDKHIQAKNSILNTYGDFLHKSLGPAWKMQPEEYNKIINHIKDLKINVIFREGAYGYDGINFIIDSNCSIGALRHEYRHMLDYIALGRPKMSILLGDPLVHWQFEIRGYMEELSLAREIGDLRAEKSILNEIKKRFKEIFGRG